MSKLPKVINLQTANIPNLNWSVENSNCKTPKIYKLLYQNKSNYQTGHLDDQKPLSGMQSRQNGF